MQVVFAKRSPQEEGDIEGFVSLSLENVRAIFEEDDLIDRLSEHRCESRKGSMSKNAATHRNQTDRAEGKQRATATRTACMRLP
jgi:hypothetical protein